MLSELRHCPRPKNIPLPCSSPCSLRSAPQPNTEHTEHRKTLAQQRRGDCEFSFSRDFSRYLIILFILYNLFKKLCALLRPIGAKPRKTHRPLPSEKTHLGRRKKCWTLGCCWEARRRRAGLGTNAVIATKSVNSSRTPPHPHSGVQRCKINFHLRSCSRIPHATQSAGGGNPRSRSPRPKHVPEGAACVEQ